MALPLLCLALAAVVSHGDAQPVQHGSSSYMYKYQAHSPAVPVTHGVYQAHGLAEPEPHGAYQAHSLAEPEPHGVYQAHSLAEPEPHGLYQAHSLAEPEPHGVYQAHSLAEPETHGAYQAHSLAEPETHGVYQALSVPLFLPAGYTAAPHHISSAQYGDFLASTHKVNAAQYSSATAESHSLQGHEDYAGHRAVAAPPVVLPSGHLAETPEVADARAHHLSAVAQARADEYYGGRAEAGYGGAYGYSGSVHGYGMPVVLPDGHIADTHEVAAAKSAHLVAVAKAKADKYYEGGEGHGYGGAYGYSGSVHGYGMPVVLPSGHIADTREVAAARSAHMVAVAHAEAREALSAHEGGESHYEHDQPHYESRYEHRPEYEHDLSQVAHYAPRQELQYESHG